MKKTALLSVLLAAAFPAVSMAQAWTLDDCIRLAEFYNSEIVQGNLRYQAQEELVKETKGKRVPVIAVGVQETLHSGNTLIMYSIDQTINMSLSQVAATLEMPLISGGSISNGKAAEEQMLLAIGKNLEATRVNVRIRVAAAYMQLLNDISQAQIANEQEEVCKREVEDLTLMVSDGRRTKADLAESRSSLSMAEYRSTLAKGKISISRLELANLLGLENEEDFEIAPMEDVSEEDISAPLLPEADRLFNHPAVMAAKYNLESSRYRAKAIAGARYPQLSLFANYNNYFFVPIGVEGIKIGSQLGTNGWGAFGLRLSIPILNVTTRNQVSRAKLAINDARVRYDESRRVVSRQARQAYYEALSAKDRYRSAIKAEASAKEAYDYRQKMYDVGRATITELGRSRVSWFASSEEVVRTKYMYFLSSKVLEYYNSYTEENAQ